MSAFSFSNPYHRNLFFAVMALLLILLISVRFLIFPLILHQNIPNAQSIVNAIIDGFVVAVVSSTITTIVLLVFTPHKELKAIEVLKSGISLKDVLFWDIHGSQRYWYKGTSAKFVRSEILPKLSANAHEAGMVKEVYILILNPKDKEACEQMAKLDRGENPDIKVDQRVRVIKKELLSTILNAYAWMGSDTYLKIHIGLHKDTSLFRFDLTDKSVISTRPNKHAYALRFDRDSNFYGTFSLDLRILYENITQLPAKDDIDFNNLSKESAEKLFNMIGLDLKEIDIRNDELEEIVEEAQKPTTPYRG